MFKVELRLAITHAGRSLIIYVFKVTNCDRFKSLKHSASLPYAYTEQGVAMLSAVLKSETAIKVSIQIMQAFVEMRKQVLNNTGLFQRLDKMEMKQIEADQKFE